MTKLFCKLPQLIRRKLILVNIINSNSCRVNMSLYKLVKFLMSDFSVKGLKKEFLYKEFFKRETCKIINFPSKGKNEGLVLTY